MRSTVINFRPFFIILHQIISKGPASSVNDHYQIKYLNRSSYRQAAKLAKLTGDNLAKLCISFMEVIFPPTAHVVGLLM